MFWTESLPLPTLLLIGGSMGLISAFFAHRMGKRPLPWFFIGFLLGAMGVFALLFSRGKRGNAPQATPPPLPTILGPDNAYWYYLDADRQQRGPMSREALAKELQKGKLTPTTYVWHADLSEWKQLSEFLP